MKTIFVLDDDPEQAELMAQALTGRGRRVRAFSDPIRALAALSLDLTQHGDTVTLSLTDFMVPPDDVPLDVARAISHWSQWIDYWAVDWDYREDTFHNQWQSYRTRKDPKLQCAVSHTYEEPGSYTIVVKVIDILGNDTTKSITIDVS